MCLCGGGYDLLASWKDVGENFSCMNGSAMCDDQVPQCKARIRVLRYVEIRNNKAVLGVWVVISLRNTELGVYRIAESEKEIMRKSNQNEV
ncbi:hypothetical protein CRYUN_Cryun13aG0159600 [Craigia yunnanensis]